MKINITASMLYDHIQCPHRISMDLHGDPKLKDEISPFVKLLWEKGNAFESELIKNLAIPFTDLSILKDIEKENATIAAMKRGDSLIYSGRIQTGNLLGVPDLLKKVDDGYIPGDIKSGAGEEGGSDLENGKPKKHYAVQLALYTDILERTGFLSLRSPFVWDIHGDEVEYQLDSPQGPRIPQTLWELYLATLQDVDSIIKKEKTTLPAYTAMCKLCHWRSACRKMLKNSNDLTLIPELGRSKRDELSPVIKNIDDLARVDLSKYIHGRTTDFARIGPASLIKFQERAKLLNTPNSSPLITAPYRLPDAKTEIFFDIETDPMRDHCYLHGFLIRDGHASENFIYYFADDPKEDDEKEAFLKSIELLRSLRPWSLYFYSKYERTIYRKLHEKYPDVVTAEEIEEIFNPENAVDLYDITRKHTEWPTNDKSIKTLATFLGFNWRDTDPSGAASIEWYHRWVEEKNNLIKNRILEYNEDDCIATRVLLDGIKDLMRD